MSEYKFKVGDKVIVKSMYEGNTLGTIVKLDVEDGRHLVKMEGQITAKLVGADWLEPCVDNSSKTWLLSKIEEYEIYLENQKLLVSDYENKLEWLRCELEELENGV